MIGRAVKDATRQAVESNIQHIYSGYRWFSPFFCYRWHCRYRQLRQALVEGHRPIVPPNPMQPVPQPHAIVAWIGLLGIMLAFGAHVMMVEHITTCQATGQLLVTTLMRPSCSVLFAVLLADRYLGSIMMPLSIHPVVLTGSLISFLINRLPESSFDLQRPLLGLTSGMVVFFATLIVSLTVAASLLSLPLFLGLLVSSLIDNQTDGDATSCSFSSINGTPKYWAFGPHYASIALAWVVQVFLVRGSLSLKLLCNIALQMADLLERLQLTAARDQLSWLCSRDPSKLCADELAGSTLESLAENLSDSVTSPLFFYLLAGPLGAFGFRVANTLDSRLGFRDHREYVGKLAARWDDVLNLVPARLTAIVLVLTANALQLYDKGRHRAKQSKMESLDGFRVAWRDASQCESPNAGWPMATMAGLLDVRLEKRAHYALNGQGAAPTHHDIRRGHRIAEGSGVVLFVLAAVAIYA